MRSILILISLLWCSVMSGCTGMFFYPEREFVLLPSDAQLHYEDLAIPTKNAEPLHGWLIPAQGISKGVVLHIHGNAGNVSYHLGGVSWLAAYGYDVILFDYRGYGRSAGKASLSNALEDVDAALHFAISRAKSAGVPVVVYGHSLGAALSVTAISRCDLRTSFAALILDGAFASYRTIAKEKMALLYLPRPLRWILGFLFPGGDDPVGEIAHLQGLPLLFIHGVEDPIVPLHHGLELWSAAPEPKLWWPLEGAGHNDTLSRASVRERLLSYLSELQR